ncbi:hypothetical protein HOF78_03665 [Candidatus Woesearchaeota archaeon]|jgi:hypothetical protein|nr:hypothetical protein [Candidatus Woesearchaeota archaeon]MBT6044637.1 hypothetical protein [Candidatus Woesearchaeota archaeon]
MVRRSLNTDSLKVLEDLAVSFAEHTHSGRKNGSLFFGQVLTAEEAMGLLEDNADHFDGIFLDSCRKSADNPKLTLPDYHFVLFRDKGEGRTTYAKIHYILGKGRIEVY